MIHQLRQIPHKEDKKNKVPKYNESNVIKLDKDDSQPVKSRINITD